MSSDSADAPRSLSQEETDLLADHLAGTAITDAAVANALRKLDDLDYGAGRWPDDWRPYCHKCDGQIAEDELMGVAFGNFYHDRCVPSLDIGPLPCGQYLGGIDTYEGF